MSDSVPFLASETSDRRKLEIDAEYEKAYTNVEKPLG